MNWIPHPTILEGERVKLIPLDKQHFEPLAACAANAAIWKEMSIDGADEDALFTNLRAALLRRAAGEEYPFTIIDKQTNTIYGSTRLFDLHPDHKKLEIGWTWYHPTYWGNGYNTECKMLLLQFCFEQLQTNRVQLKTRLTNLRSRAAIKKIGAKEEGILRNDRVQQGIVKDTVVFSIINAEWPQTKQHLLALLNP